MTDRADIPWKTLPSDLGEVPFYIVTFDKHGDCTSPAALDQLVESSKTKTDVFVFSHGWNNDWEAATNRYDNFVERFLAVRQQHWQPPSRTFAPVLVGVVWPSAALVAPWERGPDIAAAGIVDPELAALADELDPERKAALLHIVSAPTARGADDLADILAAALPAASDEVGGDADLLSPDDLRSVWQAVSDQDPTSPPRRPGGFIEQPGGEADVLVAPAAAGWNPLDKIRDAVRTTTVLLMKDRAGRVGGNGVNQMLHRLLNVGDARIALVGHSYGAKVVLSAVSNGPAPSRKVDSVLLLQPALSCYAFAADIDGHPGGYRPALDRVRLPILTTYSQHDEPLTRFFHLAVRRKSDLGEAVIAAPGQPPSKFAALGGFGPHGVDGDVDHLPMPAVGTAYPQATGRRIVAIDGTPYISSHGAVETPETAWALLCQIQA
ncbi:MAG: hypothetical protein ABWY45_17370 [Mycobacterium sp.]